MGSSILTELLSDAARDRSDKPDILPEAAVAELQLTYQAFSRPNPYRPADLVTPRSNAGVRGAGKPHIVLEILDEPRRLWIADGVREVLSSGFGTLVDMRVAEISDTGVSAFWVESWRFDTYQAAGL